MIRQSAGLIFAAIIIIMILASGCDKRPEGVLSESEMENLLTDLFIAEAYEQSPEASKLPDSIRNNLGDAVLKQHGVDRAILDSTYSWYSRNLDDYFRLYAKVEKRLDKMRKKAGGATNSGDDELKNDIWSLPKNLQLSPSAYGNSFTFSIPGDILTGGEQLIWKLHSKGQTNLDVLVGIDYIDGTSSLSRREFQDGRIDITVVADTTLKAKRIFGAIIAERRAMPIWLDSISLIKNPYDSLVYSNKGAQKKLTPPRKRVDKDKSDSISSADSKNSGASSESGKVNTRHAFDIPMAPVSPGLTTKQPRPAKFKTEGKDAR